MISPGKSCFILITAILCLASAPGALAAEADIAKSIEAATRISPATAEKAIDQHDRKAVLALTNFATRTGIGPVEAYFEKRKSETEAYCSPQEKKSRPLYLECMEELAPYRQKLEAIRALSKAKAGDDFAKTRLAYAAAIYYFAVTEDVFEPGIARLRRLYGKEEKPAAAAEYAPIEGAESRLHGMVDRAWAGLKPGPGVAQEAR